MTQSLTIFLAGPKKSGKTAISNILAEVADSLSQTYHPTQSVRILEFESKLTASKTPVSIELWDCSGDAKFSKQISAVSSMANFVVFVQGDNCTSHDVENMYLSTFSALPAAQMHVFCHGTTNRPKYTSALKNAGVSFTSMADSDKIRHEFDSVIAKCYKEVRSQNEEEEVGLLG